MGTAKRPSGNLPPPGGDWRSTRQLHETRCPGDRSHYYGELKQMKNVGYSVAAALLLVAWPGAEAAGQLWSAGVAGEDVGSVALHLGAVSPRTTLPDGAAFSGGVSGGVTGTFWPGRYIGFRGNLMTGRTTGNRAPRTKAGQEDPMLILFGADAAVRYPMTSGSLSWFPFAAFGGGAKVYDWSENLTGFESDLTYAFNFGGGVDIRPRSNPAYGFVVEMRQYTSKYKWHGHTLNEPRVNDLFVTVGVSLNR
jgi:hypothetical protein